MSKIARFDGNLQAFGVNATGLNRTVFGDTSQSDALDDNINADYLSGWEIVGVNDKPTKQDFNALGFTLGQLLAYLHQMGVAEWNVSQEYHIGSITQKSGIMYTSVTNANIGNDPDTDDGTNWAQGGFTFVNGNASLRDLTPRAGTRVYRRYHSAEGDNGDLAFRGVTGAAPATYVDNGGTIIVPTGGDGSAAWVGVTDGTLRAAHFGASGPGVQTSNIQALFDYASDLSTPVRVQFDAGHTYAIDATIDCGLPERSEIVAHGAAFDCQHNGVAFDINPAATATIPRTDTLDTVTMRGVHWKGGKFSNSNVTKTASVAIQAYFMRGFYVTDVYVENFYSAFKFGAKDTYVFENCYTYNNARHYWVPDAGVLFTEAVGLAGNDLVAVTISRSHLSVSGDEAGVYCGNRVIGFQVENTTFNGAPTVAQVRLTDANYLNSRSVSFSNVHFEQIAAGVPAVLFDASNGYGHYNVTFDDACEFVSAAIGWYGVVLDKCNYVTFGGVEFSDGSGGATEQGIYVDDDSRHVVIKEGCHFLSFTAGQEIVLQSASNRTNVSIEPTFVPEALALVGYNGVTKSTGSETIDMSTAYTGFTNFLLPPKAYALSTRARDSASATNNTNLNIAKDSGVSTTSGVGTNLTGVQNDNNRFAAGAVQADDNGDVYMAYTASGANTLTLTIALNGVYQ